MRTAEEILNEQDHDHEMLDYGMTIEAMKQYAKEAIEECASSVHQNWDLTINRQSILKLINELK